MLNEAITEQAFSLFMTLTQGKPEYEVNYHGLGIYPKSKFKYNGNACDDIMKYVDYDFRCLQASRNKLRAIFKSIYDAETKSQDDFIKFCDEARNVAAIINDDFPMLAEVLLVVCFVVDVSAFVVCGCVVVVVAACVVAIVVVVVVTVVDGFVVVVTSTVS